MFLTAIPALTACDVPANTAFWVEQLGFDELFRSDEFAGVSRDGIVFYIASVDRQIVPDNTQAWVIVEDAPALHAEWSARISTRYEDTSEPALTSVAARPWGEEFAVRDAAGNCVHFVTQASGNTTSERAPG